MDNLEMPLGLGMALAQNQDAMKKFANLNENKKREIINAAHNVSSRKEMQRYVENIHS